MSHTARGLAATLIILLTPWSVIADESEKFTGYYSYFVGEWKVAIDGVDVQGAFIVTLAPSKRCHITKFHFGDQRSEGVYGYDPTSGKWTGTGFTSEGTRWKQVFGKPKGKIAAGAVFEIGDDRTSIDGETESATNTLNVIGTKTFTVEDSDGLYRFTKS